MIETHVGLHMRALHETVTSLTHRAKACGQVFSVDWHPDHPRCFLTSGSDGAVKIWTIAEGGRHNLLLVKALCLQDGGMASDLGVIACTMARWGLGTAPQGSSRRPLYIAAAFEGAEEVVLWVSVSPEPEDLSQWREHWRTRPHYHNGVHIGNVISIAFSPGTDLLLTGCSEGSVRFMNVERRELLSLHQNIHAYTETGDRIRCVRGLTCYGDNVVSVGGDGRVIIISMGDEEDRDLSTAMRFRRDRDHDWYPARYASYSPNGQLLALPGGVHQSAEGEEECAYVVDARDPSIVRLKLCVDGHVAIMGAKFSPVITKEALAERMTIAVFTSESVVVFRTDSMVPVMCLSELHYAPITDVSWSRDGARLAVGSADGSCSVIEILCVE